MAPRTGKLLACDPTPACVASDSMSESPALTATRAVLWCAVLWRAAFYEDFARVADDESRHFGWCVQRMAELGHRCVDRGVTM